MPIAGLEADPEIAGLAPEHWLAPPVIMTGLPEQFKEAT